MENLTSLFTGMLETGILWFQQNYMNFVIAIIIFFIGKWLAKLITSGIEKVMVHAKLDKLIIDFLGTALHTVLVLLVVVAALTQLGVETTSLVALIGAAGLAVGLALKDSLQNIASGVMLIMFKPFKTGDYVEMAGVAGIVDKISIFSTLLHTVDNKEIIIPNGAIYGGNIVNYSARPTRRVDMTFGISYGDDIKKAKQVIEQVLAVDTRILSEPKTMIAVHSLGDSSVNIVVRPWVNAADYWGVYWAAQENIKMAFDENDITIPFPQMDVHHDK